jgi:4-hydroxy-tetrahydrodipicolinate reductase
MKIAIIGYGKIGRIIESMAIEKGHNIGSRIDIDNQELLSLDNLRQHDVAIEFTRPETAFENILKCLEAGLPVVSGTTGWTENVGKLIEICRKKNGSFLYASNFSLGVNILFHLNRYLATVMNRHEQYNVQMSEIHHTQKLDAPSGTALTLAKDLLEEINRKEGWALRTPGDSVLSSGSGKDKLMIEAIRRGTVAGVHEVSYESEFDILSIRHEAKDRRGFANGAIMAAEFIHDKKGFFTMKEVLDL